MESLGKKYTLERLQEIQARFPGPYFVYFIEEYNYGEEKGVGPYVGCTNDYQRRMDTHKDKILSLPEVLFTNDDLLTAADKEREIKALKGMRWENADYIRDLIRVTFALKPEVQKRRGATNSKRMKGNQPAYLMTKEARAKAGKKASIRQKGIQPKHLMTKESRAKVAKKHWVPIKAYRVETSRKGRVCTFLTKELFKEYEAQKFACEELGISNVSVSCILSPKYKNIHSAKGKDGHRYTFELA